MTVGAMHGGIPTGVHVVLEQQGRVLVMRRSGTGFFDGLFSLPGGHIEPGESLRHAAVRELAEETGVLVGPEALQYVGVVHRLSDSNRIDFFLRTTEWRGEARICEPHRCDAMSWVARNALPSNTVPYVHAALGAGGGPWMLEIGWD